MNRLKWYGLIATVTLLALPTVDTFAGARAPQPVESYEQLQRLLSRRIPHFRFGPVPRCAQCVTMMPLAVADGGSGVPAAEATSYSETNVQVQGVDEGDTVKNDGAYLYQIFQSRIRLIRAFPVTELSLASEISFDDGYTPAALYVDGDRLVVIGNQWEGGVGDVWQGAGGSTGVAVAAPRMALWGGGGESRTVIRIYDTTDKGHPVLEREVAVSGDMLASRKIGDRVYVVSRNYPRFYFSLGVARKPAASARSELRNLVPTVRDTAVRNGRERLQPLRSIYYFPRFAEPDYVTVTSLGLRSPDRPAHITTYLGAGEVVYASRENLYLSSTDYRSRTATPASSRGAVQSASGDTQTPLTHLFKFALDNGQVRFAAQGDVPGTVLNQFSMDEYDGHFRIATTTDEWFSDGEVFETRQWNNVYTLDDQMRLKGLLEHLAPDERLYSARFIGTRCYLVTFQQVDPLFVIDLQNPDNPRVLGELTIPGFSNYLHPYDEGHLLGFGKDTVVRAGRVQIQGLQAALFDVRNVQRPRQLHKIVIGGPGTDSELLYDHKALWFDAERKLLGFPVQADQGTVQGTGENQLWVDDGMPFHGAHVYHITPEGGFELKAAITHLDPAQPLDWSQWNRFIHRLVRLDEQLYTVSDSRIEVNSLTDFGESGQLDFPDEPEEPGGVIPPGEVIPMLR